ncbi:MAG: cupin domain-containing protein [Candidatus Terrybacteria bacterium CG10_big_fil_rev_8_21_14_0_10_41_10]|uniref:Cupin domain-containing protein n=1 Tax=Candidatus Terrybacteria bacterium CG10_big_fil_rev_8_21_14_0_10_41_10 TaxID=1975026 RepID=A0A2M8LAI5_9BACT|nr:MAG: cupin domain-containing protein [Candidatus Terrybacteria bacterium CG10_big_fil_rev_8_21_14_0_10_41_10]
MENIQNNFTGKNINLENLVNYQDGSVVSREILKLPTGTLTVFAFGAGQGLSEHTAPFDATIYILDGESEVKIAGETFNVTKGEMIIMPAGKPHSVKAAQKFKMLLIMIRS